MNQGTHACCEAGHKLDTRTAQIQRTDGKFVLIDFSTLRYRGEDYASKVIFNSTDFPQFSFSFNILLYLAEEILVQYGNSTLGERTWTNVINTGFSWECQCMQENHLSLLMRQRFKVEFHSLFCCLSVQVCFLCIAFFVKFPKWYLHTCWYSIPGHVVLTEQLHVQVHRCEDWADVVIAKTYTHTSCGHVSALDAQNGRCHNLENIACIVVCRGLWYLNNLFIIYWNLYTTIFIRLR